MSGQIGSSKGNRALPFYVRLVLLGFPSLLCGCDCALTGFLPSILSPAAFNIVANEYAAASCTEPTGNTVVLSGDIYGATGTCREDENGFFTHSQCNTDGTMSAQLFAADDDTCSGDVWVEVLSAIGTGNLFCIVNDVDGMYYRSVYHSRSNLGE